MLSLKSRIHITVSTGFVFRSLTLDVVRIKGPNPLSRTSMSCLPPVMWELCTPHSSPYKNGHSLSVEYLWCYHTQMSIFLCVKTSKITSTGQAGFSPAGQEHNRRYFKFAQSQVHSSGGWVKETGIWIWNITTAEGFVTGLSRENCFKSYLFSAVISILVDKLIKISEYINLSAFNFYL